MNPTMNDWGRPLLVEDATLCVSELVGNAVLHATPDGSSAAFGSVRRITVAFRAWPNWLFIEVADEDSAPRTLPVGDPVEYVLTDLSSEGVLQDSGRGLHLIQCLADAVWWTPREVGGKSVFCRFGLEDGENG
ncbi:ATP-binding protein [Streptomyces iconiensis]|uniref:ATP-binding protein n=1 Tax=Streptomyces iconiensis TaxID=1384038 RepID=A0ABT6ZZI5_9ACTN|nr:ATP-binding protein [Streptomyces iconiensis]MDJ1134021.1 ATP-binding protein [Streptomyces iconiensis]